LNLKKKLSRGKKNYNLFKKEINSQSYHILINKKAGSKLEIKIIKSVFSTFAVGGDFRGVAVPKPEQRPTPI